MPRANHVGQNTDTSLLDYPGPDEINVPSDDFNDYTLVLYGQKAKGKTTIAASFPETLTLMLEPFRKGLSIRQLSLQKFSSSQIKEGSPDTWQRVLNTTQKWLDDPSINRLSFDSIDLFYQCCQESICARNNINVPGDAGKSSFDIWIQIREEFSSYMNLIKSEGMQITMLSHVKERDEVDLEGGKMKFSQPSCSPACLAYIRQAADIVLQIGTYNEKRAAMVRDPVNTAFVANGAQGKFQQPDGKNIYIFELPDISNNSTNLLYQTIVDAFNNKLWDIDTSQDQRIVSSTAKIGGSKKGPTKK
jgi:hypothetical protein